jgi:hypothetical protein
MLSTSRFAPANHPGALLVVSLKLADVLFQRDGHLHAFAAYSAWIEKDGTWISQMM